MENELEKFRVESLPVMTKAVKFAEKEFDLDSLRYQFISKHFSAAPDKDAINKLLWEIQLNLSNEDETVLNRFGAASALIIASSKEGGAMFEELTKIADRYVKDFRKAKNGTPFSEVALSPEDEGNVTRFRERLSKIQSDLINGGGKVGF